MSHQSIDYLPWPTIPAPRSQEEADMAWADGGAGPSNPATWAAALAVIASSPEGVPLPPGWTTTAPYLGVCQSGEMFLSMSRIVRVGEGEDEGKVWGESVTLTLARVKGPLADAVAYAPRSTYTSGRSKAERARDELRMSQQEAIRGWANSASACTIPWGTMMAGGRRDIADCLDALCILSAQDSRRPELRATVSSAMELYPVAAPGLRVLVLELGLGAEFGLS